MIDEEIKGRYPYVFLLMYALIYMGISVLSTYLPVYFDRIGFSKSAIGLLLASGTLVSMAAQPLWGMASDRAASKNTVFKIMILGSAISMILIPLSKVFIYVMTVYSLLALFYSSIQPVSDAITLEYLENRRWKFGPIRMAGTLGFAFMSVLSGITVKQNIEYIFPLYFCIVIIAFFAAFRLPAVKGHQHKDERVPVWRMFKNRDLVIFMTFNFITQFTFGFYYSFFSIHFMQLGGSSTLLGIAMLVSASSEIPFLLFADKIVARLGIRLTLIGSTAVMAIRWTLMSFVTDVNVLVAVNATHGLTFIVFAFCMATFIAKNVPKELRATGQTINAFMCLGLARMLGSAIGGIVSDVAGIRPVFLYSALINITAIPVFGMIFIIGNKNGKLRV